MTNSLDNVAPESVLFSFSYGEHLQFLFFKSVEIREAYAENVCETLRHYLTLLILFYGRIRRLKLIAINLKYKTNLLKIFSKAFSRETL